MSERTIGVGVIGMGFMGRTHVRAYAGAHAVGRANRLVRLCDQDPARVLAGATERGNFESEDEGPLFDPAATPVGDDPGELFADDAVELVSVCTPTDTHVPLAIRALEAGKHVVVEKPVALRADEVRRLADVARAHPDQLCMPAMCIRFWPGWSWLKGAIEDGTYGRVTSAVFRRLAPPPGWGKEFYEDTARSGGALFDLHVHDADLVRHLFGPPDALRSTGTPHHVTTLYRYEDGPAHVVAEGGWDHTEGFPFEMGYTVVFERATATWRMDREPHLALYVRGREQPVRDVLAGTGYDHELRHALAVVAGDETPLATVDEAVGLTEMLEAERAALA